MQFQGIDDCYCIKLISGRARLRSAESLQTGNPGYAHTQNFRQVTPTHKL